jgi:hypothetical protein
VGAFRGEERGCREADARGSACEERRELGGAWDDMA